MRAVLAMLAVLLLAAPAWAQPPASESIRIELRRDAPTRFHVNADGTVQPLPDYAPDRAANWMVIGFGGLAGADVAMTMRCIGAGTCREANPLLRPLQDRPAWFGFAKAAVNTASIIAVYKWTKPHSKTRYAVLGVLIIGQGAVVALNARQLQ